MWNKLPSGGLTQTQRRKLYTGLKGKLNIGSVMMYSDRQVEPTATMVHIKAENGFEGWSRNFFAAKRRNKGSTFIAKLEIPNTWSKDADPFRFRKKLTDFFKKNISVSFDGDVEEA